MERTLALIPMKIGYDLGETDCSQVGYVVPEHPDCRNGSGRLVVRENQLDKPLGGGGSGTWLCDCGQTFSIDMTLNSPDDLPK